jgi:prevent-host-death family protein
MGPVNIKDARRRLSDLVTAAERGESVVITRRGKEVARIVPPAPKPLKRFPDLSEFRASIKVKGRSLTDELLAMRGEERY